ncbi:aldose 1-epimerase [Ferrimonas sediminum]|uniref:Aldose 1-epimerase n=1 Tax=Ferrimonas sediminum TaxID=718193 RepID=A0A1G8VLM8_9GAMM|nr:aldose epimerase family protein [Ferrimonas sediminum]SDJ66080.1 aldose 1-epimerase [Ferrimonas sediminum]
MSVKITPLSPWEHYRVGELPRIQIENDHLRLEVLALGGIVRKLELKRPDGRWQNLVLGCDSAGDYLSQKACLGSVVGRWANRIANGRCLVDGYELELDANLYPHHLHGGLAGFHHKVFSLTPIDDGIKLTLTSAHGEAGFPGNLQLEVFYRLKGSQWLVTMNAEVDRPCPVNLTQHSYFNLGGPITGYQLYSNAPYIVMTDKEGIPVTLEETSRNPLDLNPNPTIGELMDQPLEALRQVGGLDHCYLWPDDDAKVKPRAQLLSPASGIKLTLHSDQPGLQLYTGNHLGGTPAYDGKCYKHHQGMALEPGLWPDAPNQPGHTKGILRPGETYQHHTVYQFDNV